MQRTKKRIVVTCLVALGLGASVLAVRACAPVWAFLIAPSATRWVEMNRDWLASTSAGLELEALADQLMKQYDATAIGLPEAEFSNGGRALPLARLPAKFRERAGRFGDPQLFIRLDADSKPDVLVVSWGHLRQAILVFREPPIGRPNGILVNKVSERTYVVADERARCCGPS